MRFATSILASALVAIATAQNAAQSTALTSALSSFAEAQLSNPTLTTIALAIETNPSIASVFASISSLEYDGTATVEVPLTVYPTDFGIRAYYSSVQEEIASIYLKNGFTASAAAIASAAGVATPTGGAGARPTAAILGAMAGAAVGVMGMM